MKNLKKIVMASSLVLTSPSINAGIVKDLLDSYREVDCGEIWRSLPNLQERMDMLSKSHYSYEGIPAQCRAYFARKISEEYKKENELKERK